MLCGGTAPVELTQAEIEAKASALVPAPAPEVQAIAQKSVEVDNFDAEVKLLASLHTSAMEDIETRVARAVEAERQVS